MYYTSECGPPAHKQRKLTIMTFAITLIFRSLKNRARLLIGVLPAIKLTKDF
jgi:hypothetical protein